MVFVIISLGASLFAFDHMNDIFEGENVFPCNTDNWDRSAYIEASQLRRAMTSQASCYATIDRVFDNLDRNKDDFISRCEHAEYMHAIGFSDEYSLKFAEDFSRWTFRRYCLRNFDD